MIEKEIRIYMNIAEAMANSTSNTQSELRKAKDHVAQTPVFENASSFIV